MRGPLAFLFAAVYALAAPVTTKRNPKDELLYVRIPPGTFSMGCSRGDAECFTWEAAPHQVRVAKGFWIGQTEVTQQAYSRVIGTNPSLYKGADLPVDQVSWFAARGYCEAVGMRLPTEVEWEYAARGGAAGARYGPLEDIAWFDPNSNDQTHPAALKKGNGFGLYDVLGNVWEWVQDRYEADPRKRILRGGSFYNLARDLRISNRLWATPETAHRNMGVRCAGDL